MKRIKLTQGKFALVSNIDYTYLNQWKWCVLRNRNTFYAVRNIIKPHRLVLMHRIILERLGCENFAQGEHKDGNGLNNQRGNLRPATNQQNSFNQRSHIDSTSRFKGVTWNKEKQRWKTYICLNGKQKHLGYFNTELIAAKRYNDAAIEYFGEFAKLNKI